MSVDASIFDDLVFEFESSGVMSPFRSPLSFVSHDVSADKYFWVASRL